MFRSGVRGRVLRLAAAVAAAGVAVAGCANVKMGAAAVIGDQRISAAQLTTEVAGYNHLFAGHQGTIIRQFQAAQTPQQVLGWLVSYHVADRIAQRNHISVTPAQQAQSQRMFVSAINTSQQEAAQQQGMPALPRLTMNDVAAAIGLAPDMEGGFSRYLAIENTLGARLERGASPAQGSAGSQALSSSYLASQCRAAKSLNIQISPQYGVLDYSLRGDDAAQKLGLPVYEIIPAASALSKASPAAPQVAGAQLTPHC